MIHAPKESPVHDISIRDNRLYINRNEFSLPGYTVIKPIGTGANAKAFLIHNILLDRHEVLKIWFPHKGRRVVDKNQYLAEIRKNAQLTADSSFATIYFGDIKDDYCFCVMEYCPGKTLKEFLATNPCYYKRWAITRGICDSLSYIYKKGIYHGDLHDRNIIADWDINSFKILDLGTSILSGKKYSQERDARLLYQFGIEMLPEIKDMPFYADESFKKLPSPLILKGLRHITTLLMPYSATANEEIFSRSNSIGEMKIEIEYEAYHTPDLHREVSSGLPSWILTIPIFSLHLVEQYLYEIGFTDMEVSSFYLEVSKRMNQSENIDINNRTLIQSQYEEIKNNYINEHINIWNVLIAERNVH